MTKTIDTHSDLVIYQSEDGILTFDAHIFDETVWLTQKQMAELFGKGHNDIEEKSDLINLSYIK